jgi:hypothetical protein
MFNIMELIVVEKIRQNIRNLHIQSFTNYIIYTQTITFYISDYRILPEYHHFIVRYLNIINCSQSLQARTELQIL